MYCLEHCVHVVPSQYPELEYRTPIVNHCQPSHTGYNFYFCAAHRACHCMLVNGNLDQPLCGECAAFYYQNCLSVVWEEDYDRPAGPPVPEGSYRNVIVNQLIDMDPWIWASHDVDNQHLRPPVSDDAGDELIIPREDPTFQGLGPVRLANTRQHGLSRLCFRSPTGAIGWMPCGSDIGRRAEFIHLAEIEKDGDAVFKRIRVWTCKMQGYYYLPKDIRWCLWGIYMLCTEALYNCRDVDEAEIWEIRDVIDVICAELRRLFHVLHLPVPHHMPALNWRGRRLQPS